ncbi:MAG TPA: ABC transporter ATP-binding protein [Pyrinomonadaceae bacterium]
MAQPVKKSVAVSTLRVVDLRRSFDSPLGQRIEVLRGVSFEVEPGEVVAVVGASGSGKSTLLQLIGGLDAPDHGSVLLGTDDISAMSVNAVAGYRQTNIGFVFQFHYLLNDLSAIENVALPLLISRKSAKDARQQARILLTEVGLGERADHPAAHLSGGEQQRVALARALVSGPQLLLADEPTGNLDSSISDEIGKIIISYARDREAMAIIATHNEDLARSCDRVLLLEAGRIR